MALFLTILLVSGCKKDELKVQALTFDMALFEQNIRDYLEGNTVGFAYSITHDKGKLYNTGAWGQARIGEDYPANPNQGLPMTPEMRVPVSSLSKFVTAILAIKILEQEGVLPEENIVPYLPEAWTEDFSTAKAFFSPSFRHLLQMRSPIPFNQINNTPNNDQLRQALALPHDETLRESAAYQNGNFALFRVLLTRLLTQSDDDAIDMDASCDYYIQLINTHIFSLLDIRDVELKFSGAQSERPLCYNWSSGALDMTQDAQGNIGFEPIDQTNRAGESGMRISMVEMSKLIAYFRHDASETIVTKEQREYILEHELGLSETVDAYYGKSGTYSFQSAGRVQRAFMMMYSNDIEVCITTNTQISALPGVNGLPPVNSMGQMLREAHKNAWK